MESPGAAAAARLDGPATGRCGWWSRTVAKDDPDPKALACYGCCCARRARRRRLAALRRRPTRQRRDEQFLAWCCDAAAGGGQARWLLVWDNASWHVSKRGARLDSRAQPAGQAAGQGVRIVVPPARQEPLAQPDRAQVGPWQARGGRARPAAQRPELADRVCAPSAAPMIAPHHSRKGGLIMH